MFYWSRKKEKTIDVLSDWINSLKSKKVTINLQPVNNGNSTKIEGIIVDFVVNEFELTITLSTGEKLFLIKNPCISEKGVLSTLGSRNQGEKKTLYIEIAS